MARTKTTLDVRLNGLDALRDTLAEASWHIEEAERLLVGIGTVSLGVEAVPHGRAGSEDSGVRIELEPSGKGVDASRAEFASLCDGVSHMDPKAWEKLRSGVDALRDETGAMPSAERLMELY